MLNTTNIMKISRLLSGLCTILIATLSFTSCTMMWHVDEDMDVKKSIRFAGQWTGDFGMFYNYRYNGRIYTFDSFDTDIVFYPDYDGATYGWGKQVDYYDYGPYTHIYNRFDWEIRNGVVYLQYYNDPSLDCAIYDYVMTSDRFQGRFGNTNDRFYLSKISDYYNWSIYTDFYYYFPNGNWYWSSYYAPDMRTRSTGEEHVFADSTATIHYADTVSHEGIIFFGNRKAPVKNPVEM